jgi:hypothetical protein
MRFTVRNGLTGLLLIGAFAIAGCGGSSSATPGAATQSSASASTASTASSAPSAASAPFVAQAEAVCRRVNAEIVALDAKAGTAAEVKRVVPPTIAIERKGIAALGKLDPPASLARDWRRMLDDRRKLAVMLGGLLDAAKKNDGTSIKPLAASKKRVHVSLTKTATANGFKDCAKVGRVG